MLFRSTRLYTDLRVLRCLLAPSCASCHAPNSSKVRAIRSATSAEHSLSLDGALCSPLDGAMQRQNVPETFNIPSANMFLNNYSCTSAPLPVNSVAVPFGIANLCSATNFNFHGMLNNSLQIGLNFFFGLLILLKLHLLGQLVNFNLHSTEIKIHDSR